MRKKKRARYGDYVEVIKGELYGSINLPKGGGKYRKKRKKVATRIEARHWALEQLAMASNGLSSGVELQTFIDLAEWYKRYFLVPPVYEKQLKVEGSKDWQKSRNKLERMAQHFGPKRLATITAQDLLAYARQRRDKDKVTTATINRDFALMRAMFKKGHEADKNIPVPRFPINTSAEVERDRVMTFDEEKRLLQACEASETLEYKRNGRRVSATHRTNREHLRAIIILAVDTAMRAGEVTGIVWSDVSLETGTINIRKEISKTGKARKVGMTPRVRQALSAIEPKTGRVFPYQSVRKAFGTACKRAGIKDLRFHDLRHTATTRMIRAGIPHMEVMKTTGHTQIRTFLRYLNLSETTVQGTAEQLARYLEGID